MVKIKAGTSQCARLEQDVFEPYFSVTVMDLPEL